MSLMISVIELKRRSLRTIFPLMIACCDNINTVHIVLLSGFHTHRYQNVNVGYIIFQMHYYKNLGLQRKNRAFQEVTTIVIILDGKCPTYNITKF